MSDTPSGEVLLAGDAGSLLQAHGLRTFSDFMAFEGGELVTRKRGRTVVRLQLGERTFYLKRNRFHAGEFWKTLSRFRLPPRSARQEWRSILAVRDAGIPTVPPVAMGEEVVFGVEKASFTMTEALYDAEPLEDVFRREFTGALSPSQRREKQALIRQVAEIARRLHSSGMYHQDLYLGHFLRGKSDILYLIDLQRVVCCGRVPRRYLVKDLGQLAYSAEITAGLSRSDQMRFFLAYLGLPRLGTAEKELLRQVLAKCRRIARHTVKLLERRRRRGDIVIDLSVVIVNWNTRDLLHDCLHSLQEQVTGLSLEVFVVDNGSNDGSVAMVRENFPSVIVIENGCNLGFARANNVALRRAKGRFWLLLNSDTVVRKGALEGLLRTMEADPAIGVGGLQLLNEDGSLQNSVSNAPTLLTELGNKRLLRLLWPSRYPGKEHHFHQPLRVESVIGACMMVRREAAEEVGLLDEDYFFFLEETDWCVRMARAGWKVVHDPRFTIYHLQGKSAGKVNVRARIEYWRSRYTFFRKHSGRFIRGVLRTGLLLRVCANMLTMSLANLLTFCKPRLRNKWQVYACVILWHLRLCPPDGGLEKKRI